MSYGFLDETLSERFRDAINSSPIFSEGDQKSKFNMICAVMDRIDTCIYFLNKHSDYPKSEDAFISFFMYCTMLKDAVYLLIKNIRGKNPPDKTDFFADTFQSIPTFDHSCQVSDDKFFAYMRSLVFAHPIETNRARFLRKTEVQYSPYVMVGDVPRILSRYPDGIGIRIYSSIDNDDINLLFSFQTLKNYIKNRYENLLSPLKWAQKAIRQKKKEWKTQKIDRSLAPIELLYDIKSILETRYISTSEVDLLIRDLTYSITDTRNKDSVEKYRNAIIGALPDICDGVEALQDIWGISAYERLRRYPKRMHDMASYQLEKITSYLRLDKASDNYRFGIICVELFANGFAQKWVSIDTERMEPEEILMLVRTACFLEAEEQERENEALFSKQ